MHCPQVHFLSTISPLSTESFLDASPKEFLKFHHPLADAAEIPSFDSENVEDSGSGSDLAELCKLMDASLIDLL
jgi:hypothetical protein